MSDFPELALNAVLTIALPILVFGMILAMYRLIVGPELPHRVVALDILATLTVGVIAVDAVNTGQSHFLRAGIVLALVAFLGTVAFAYYLELRARKP